MSSLDERAKTELYCSKCKESASVGTPGINKDGQILCPNCLRDARDNTLRYSIKQRSNSFGDLEPEETHMDFFYNGHTLRFRKKEKWNRWGELRYGYSLPLWEISAWTNDNAAFPIFDGEKVKFIEDPSRFFRVVEHHEKHKVFRCTTYKKISYTAELGGRPLFAGKVCKPCWAKHLAFLESEKKSGHTCSMCGQPYGNCSC